MFLTELYIFQIGVSAQRKHEPETQEEYWQRVKSRKLAKTAPHKLNSASAYASLQNSEHERIWDDCPAPEIAIPPLVLLYSGFGRFVDSTRCAAMSPDTFSDPEITSLKRNVDKIFNVMCEVNRELGKQDVAKGPLLRILFPDDPGISFRHDIPGQSEATDGHILTSHGGPRLIVGFKRTIDMAEPQVAYFMRLALGANQFCRGWRHPTLGIIIRGEVQCPPSPQMPLTRARHRVTDLLHWSCHN
jgi:hypothetical protein